MVPLFTHASLLLISGGAGGRVSLALYSLHRHGRNQASAQFLTDPEAQTKTSPENVVGVGGGRFRRGNFGPYGTSRPAEGWVVILFASRPKKTCRQAHPEGARKGERTAPPPRTHQTT